MKRNGIWQLWAVAIAAVAVLAVGCTWGDSPTIITVNQEQGQGNTGPTASPSPGTSGPVEAVRVSTFGTETCPGGGSPATEANSVRVGCFQPLTCTPLLAGGVPAPPGAHPPAPEAFVIILGDAAAELLAVENPYNRDLHGLSPGTVRVRCAVAGATPGDLDVSVLQ